MAWLPVNIAMILGHQGLTLGEGSDPCNGATSPRRSKRVMAGLQIYVLRPKLRKSANRDAPVAIRFLRAAPKTATNPDPIKPTVPGSGTVETENFPCTNVY
jgi:hypothetical protein